MGRINSCIGLNITHLDHLFEFLKSSEGIFYLFELISVDNKKLIKKLLSKKIICYSELCFDILKVFCISQHKKIPCGLSKDVLNTFVHSYLLAVIDNSHRNLYLTQCASIYSGNVMQKLAFEFLNRINTLNIRDFKSIFVNISEVNLPCDTIDFDQKVLSEKIMCNLLNIDKDYQSFLVPLEQDYTKSSKGYCSQIITIKNEANTNIRNKTRQSKDRLITESFNIIVEFTNKRDQKVVKGNSYTESFRRNIITADQHDSESDESIVFIENNEETIDFLKYDSDSSDESIVFTENYNTKRLPATVTKLSDYNKCFLKDSRNSFANLVPYYSDCNDYEIQLKHEELDVSNNSFIELISSDSSEDSENDDDWNTEHEENETAFSFENSSEPFDMLDFQNLPQFSYMTGGGFINPCFEDNSDIALSEFSPIKSINDKWNDSMKNVTSEPRESKRVSFVPSPDLESVHFYEADDDDYQYSIHVLNQLRFQNRISDFEPIIASYLTPEHRAKVYNRNYCSRR